MKMDVRNKGDIALIAFSGHLTLNLGEYNIKKTITDLLNEGIRKFILQLEDIEFINSAGIGELVGAFITVANRGGKIKLCCIPDKVDKMLQVTQVISIFEIYDSENEAADSF